MIARRMTHKEVESAPHAPVADEHLALQAINYEQHSSFLKMRAVL